VIVAIAERVKNRQRVFTETGGLHAAAIFDQRGEISVVKEDVGRHNATDKAIGTLLQAGGLPANSCGLFVSGRASFELMQKALVAGIPLLVVTLIGFLRGKKFNIYAGADRIV
jgi:FdhD protein